MRRMLETMAVAGILILPCRTARTGPVDNGNDLALEFSTAKDVHRKEIAEEATGKIFFFRYLRISNLEKGQTRGLPFIRMNTVEPSSDVRVDFTVRKKVSLKKADPLKTGEAIAVTGRIKSIGSMTNTIVLEPVIVRYKDRLSPKVGKELLSELDSDAIYFNYTGAGPDREVRITYKDKDLLPWHKIKDPLARKEAMNKMIKRMGSEGFAVHLLGKLEAREWAREAAKDRKY